MRRDTWYSFNWYCTLYPFSPPEMIDHAFLAAQAPSLTKPLLEVARRRRGIVSSETCSQRCAADRWRCLTARTTGGVPIVACLWWHTVRTAAHPSHSTSHPIRSVDAPRPCGGIITARRCCVRDTPLANATSSPSARVSDATRPRCRTSCDERRAWRNAWKTLRRTVSVELI